ncbi:MAG: hypothetical protein AAF610_15575, partial [Pseudomonadota bacterium]
QIDIANESGPVSIMNRLYVAGYGERLSLYGPTKTQRQSFDIARSQYGVWRRDFDKLVFDDLRALKKKATRAGAPWSPGLGASPTGG